ncbi:MAG: site-specific DNA-methyltransferase [Oscillospiraceae bacterium]|nr:site-specific DNA-methyltransferase [Oscillospiraceae bacterium]
MNGIIRVFPRYSKQYTPTDDYAFVGMPMMGLPPHDEVHVSCVFTWDMELCEELKYQWQGVTDKPVKLGGVAYGSPSDDFTPGLYVKKGITFTSRGCDNNCNHCAVPLREGTLKELQIIEGRVIQDNNFLQCSKQHKDKVFEMLKKQAQICFKGGLQPNLIDGHFVDNVKGLRIKELWLACDHQNAIGQFTRAATKLKQAGFTRSHIRCYVLIGDDMSENENRLHAVYKAGAMPFAQLFQPVEPRLSKVEYSDDWKRFARMWQRPAATKAHYERNTSYKDYKHMIELIKCELYHDNFQNYKTYNIPRAQLVICDIPYNVGENAYGSSPEWYNGGNNANGESDKAKSSFFGNDGDFNIAEYFHFCHKLLKNEPKEKGEAPCMIEFCAHQQQQSIIDYAAKHGFKKYTPLVFIKRTSPQVLKANMRICGATEYALVLYRDKLPKFRNNGEMVLNWFWFERDKHIERIHNTQKPVNLLKRLISIYTDPHDVVIDPCEGSGSTLRAAYETGRHSYGTAFLRYLNKHTHPQKI